MNPKEPLVLPDETVEHARHMRHIKRLIASHAEMFGPLNTKQKRIVKGIRVSEAVGAFVDFRFYKRDATALAQRPYERIRNYGISLWRDDELALDAPLEEHEVESKEQPLMEKRLAAYRIAKAASQTVDPLLLETNRPFCTEHQALQHFMDKHDPGQGKVSGDLSLYTERFPCKACCDVIAQFINKQPDVRLFVLYEHSLFRVADRTKAEEMTKKIPRLVMKALKYKKYCKA